jgi:hypothetical protein
VFQRGGPAPIWQRRRVATRRPSTTPRRAPEDQVNPALIDAGGRGSTVRVVLRFSHVVGDDPRRPSAAGGTRCSSRWPATGLRSRTLDPPCRRAPRGRQARHIPSGVRRGVLLSVLGPVHDVDSLDVDARRGPVPLSGVSDVTNDNSLSSLRFLLDRSQRKSVRRHVHDGESPVSTGIARPRSREHSICSRDARPSRRTKRRFAGGRR